MDISSLDKTGQRLDASIPNCENLNSLSIYTVMELDEYQNYQQATKGLHSDSAIEILPEFQVTSEYVTNSWEH